MMVSSYWLGQKYYPVPYAVKKLLAYLSMVILIYGLHIVLTKYIMSSLLFSMASGALLFLFFAWFVSRIEAKELARLPVIGKFFKR
jgi:hypothetical protein